MGQRVRVELRVQGVVQGVGFRPFVHGLATRLGLAGFVANDGEGVVIQVEGAPDDVAAFEASLPRQAPALSVIELVTPRAVPVVGEQAFRIDASSAGAGRRTLVSPDVATCEDCLRELRDPSDRRFRYPFTNCTNCGPRFTIIRDVPYDRPSTTMATFEMCAECRAEYDDPADRRFHAQPVCCPACGPSLRFVDRVGDPPGGEPIAATAEALRAGRVMAVKGLGGYHLAALASSAPGVAALRARKHREDKPFAVMVADVAQAAELCLVSPEHERSLLSRRAPIVLMPRRSGADVAAEVAPGTHELGVMLPYTPLHHLLLEAVGAPIVLTSGNLSDEPIAYHDDEAFSRLTTIADAFLVHDRAIHVRTDDSVVRPMGGRETVVRRSRGYAPEPLRTAFDFPRHVLACGAELKNTFCLGKDDHAFVSHHVGDLENAETLAAFTEGIEHFCRLFDVRPEIVAHDLHPEYLSTKYAEELADVTLVGVQHHHAHIASCLADNGRGTDEGPVIGVAYDGLGYGCDGTLWGGEIFVADLLDATRVGSFAGVPMPGGATAIRQPWRMALAYLEAAYDGHPPDDLDVARRNSESWRPVRSVLASGVNSPVTSSVGRLFDAVAAIVGLRDAISYEGQAAIELERIADRGAMQPYDVAAPAGSMLLLDGPGLVREVAEDVRRGTSPAVVAGRFHASVAALTVDACTAVSAATGLGTVALSGGVWQNVVLLALVVEALQRDGFTVLTHARVPTNDGGISLGQAAVAAARDRAGLLEGSAGRVFPDPGHGGTFRLPPLGGR